MRESIKKEDFEKAFSKDNMKHAWKKYIRKEFRKDVIKDAINYEDFAYNLDQNINRIIGRVRAGEYYPQPLLRLDILKPSFTLRPISIPEIEDRLVFQSILNILLPRIDPQLSDGVRSYRLQREDEMEEKEEEEDDFYIMGYWFEAWPDFMEDNIKFTQEYEYLAISDITAYFESIEHTLLRDYLRDFSNDRKMINLLMSMLELWAWKSELGYTIRRGIPQGFDTSAYVGNFFLDRMDKRVERQLVDDGKYLRYGDDIRVYTNAKEEARRTILELNRAMRDLNLIIKDSKTDITEGPFALQKDENDLFIDDETRVLGKLWDEIKEEKIENINTVEIFEKIKPVFEEILEDDKRNRWGRYSHGTKYKFCLALLRKINNPFAIENALLQLEKRPDMTINITKYLSQFPKEKEISAIVIDLLLSEKNQFEFQEAELINLLGKMWYRDITKFEKYLWDVIETEEKHWYPRCRAILQVGKLCAIEDLTRLVKLYNKFHDVEMKRYTLVACSRLHYGDRNEFFRRARYESSPKIHRLLTYFEEIENEDRAIKYSLQKLKKKKDLDEEIYRAFIMRYISKKKYLKELINILEKKSKEDLNPTIIELINQSMKIARSRIDIIK